MKNKLFISFILLIIIPINIVVSKNALNSNIEEKNLKARDALIVFMGVMDFYKADNGTYPKHIKSLEELKNRLKDECSPKWTMTIGGSTYNVNALMGSLFAAATDRKGLKFKLYSIGQDEKHYYAIDQKRRIVGPNALSDLITELGSPFPEDISRQTASYVMNIYDSTINADDYNKLEKYKYEYSQFRNAANGEKSFSSEIVEVLNKNIFLHAYISETSIGVINDISTYAYLTDGLQKKYFWSYGELTEISKISDSESLLYFEYFNSRSIDYYIFRTSKLNILEVFKTSSNEAEIKDVDNDGVFEIFFHKNRIYKYINGEFISMSDKIIQKPQTYTKYTKKEVMFAKWGEGKGEIPRKKIKLGPIEIDASGVPIFFKIDPAGNIYFNFGMPDYQFMKFNSKGEYVLSIIPGFICTDFAIDDLGRIMLININGPDFGNGKVFDKNGKHIKDIKVKWSERARFGIYYQNGNIYNVDDEIIYEIDDMKNSVLNNPENRTRKTQLNNFIKIKSDFGSNLIMISGLENIGGKKGEIKISLKKIINSSGTVLIKDIDVNGRIYLIIQDMVVWKKLDDCIITVIDKEGNLLEEVKLNRYGNSAFNKFSSYVKHTQVDAEGNIFQLWLSEDGIHVTKWKIQ